MLAGVDRVLLRVASLEAAVAYYRDVLGMKLLRHEKRAAAFAMGDGSGGAGGAGEVGGAGCGELVLHDSPDLPSQGIYFRVDDVKALYAQRDALKLKFAIPPSTVSRGHSATVKDPFGNVLLLLDRTKEASAGDAIESAAPAGGTLFSGIEQRVTPKREPLAAAYEAIGRTADDLPYTRHFESLFDLYTKAFANDPGGARPTRQETWRHLLNVRKAGRLPKLGEAKSAIPEADESERALIRKLLGEELGKRDRLPYSKTFDDFVAAFNAKTKRNLTPHQLWRLVATLAK